ncbi:MAG: CDP-diacylglycerol--glycerol-3-phosphate 3-phosphatidyltransferase [bacterium]
MVRFAAIHIRDIPNILTLCRIAVIPILVVLLSYPGPVTRGVAALLFALASTTDYLDGYLARRYDVTSSAGKLLDPMADKLLVMAALIMLVSLREGAVPAWMVVVILGREILVTGLRGVGSSRGVIIEAGELGKYKTTLQSFAITGLLIYYPYFSIDFHLGGMYFLWASLVLSIWSAVSYFRRFWPQTEPGRKSPG